MNRFMKHIPFRIYTILLSLVMLCACTSISKEIQSSMNSHPIYTEANSLDENLEHSPLINLSKYKSVHERNSHHNNIAMALAASGGGYRAANLTLGVLLGLEKMHSARLNMNMLQQVDYFSTVSGGGFG